MPHAIRVFAVFAAAHILSYFFRSANAVIAEDLRQALQLDPAQLGLMSSLFFGAFALSQLPFGALVDRFPARVATPTLMLVGVVGSLAFASAEGFGRLALGRALLGVGTAGILMGGLKALSQLLPPKRFARVSGMLVAVGSSGALIATAPLAHLAASFGWRGVFYGGAAALLVSAATIAMVARTPRAPAAVGALDESGALDSSGAPTAKGGGAGVMGGGATSATAGFGRIFRSVAMWRMAGMAFALMGTTFAYQSLWAGPYLVEAAGMANLAAGNLLLFVGVGLILGFFTSGWVVERFGAALVVAMAAVVNVAAQVGLAVLPTVAPPVVLGALLFVFAASGAFSTQLYGQATSVLPANLTGRAVTFVNLFMFLGGFALQWAIGVVVGAGAATTDGASLVVAYRYAWLATSALVLVALAFYLPLLRKDRPRSA
ncbi:MAG: MFS transporter [Trueperaceae bacterium]